MTDSTWNPAAKWSRQAVTSVRLSIIEATPTRPQRRPIWHRVSRIIVQISLMLAVLSCAPALGFWLLRVVR